jgi:DNA-binding beta-propeller fold protein YncE
MRSANPAAVHKKITPRRAEPAEGYFFFEVIKGLNMRPNAVLSLIALVAWGMLMVTPTPSSAAVEWELIKSLNTGARPVDVAVSADGKTVFVLTEDGVVSIYTGDGALTEKMNVGSQAERIAVAPDGERLYVVNRAGRRVDVIQLDYVREIDLSGAPYKGREKAPVTIVVFSDFQ